MGIDCVSMSICKSLVLRSDLSSPMGNEGLSDALEGGQGLSISMDG